MRVALPTAALLCAALLVAAAEADKPAEEEPEPHIPEAFQANRVLDSIPEDGIPVEVTGGTVVGRAGRSRAGRPYAAFEGIPFAAPMSAETRFTLPRPVEAWAGTLSALTPGPVCAQSGYGVPLEGQEDCLHLSVYTPALVEGSSVTEPLPVLVWLPGGAFIVGGASAYDPSLLLDRDVVLVVPQYRVGLLGFLPGAPSMQGNFGLHDQAAALRWVRDNIAAFGGDPGRVTLGGDCAGGASALYHTLSNSTAGLYHRVLSVSGVPLSPWTRQPSTRHIMMLISNNLKCPSHDLQLNQKCLRERPLEKLLITQMYVLEATDLYTGNSGVGPTKLDPSEEHDPFLTVHPVEAYDQDRFAKVPTLLMTSRDVGSWMVDTAIYQWMQFKLEEKGLEFGDEMIRILLDELDLREAAAEQEAVRQLYLPGLSGSDLPPLLPGLAQVLGDALYHTGTLHTARHLTRVGVPTSLLRFDFKDGPHIFNLRHPDPATAPPLPPAADHGDELYYLLPPGDAPPLTPTQAGVADVMLSVVEDFVYGRGSEDDWVRFNASSGECGVVTEEGAAARAAFLPLERAAMTEMFLRQQHLRYFERKEEASRTKDEL